MVDEDILVSADVELDEADIVVIFDMGRMEYTKVVDEEAGSAVGAGSVAVTME